MTEGPEPAATVKISPPVVSMGVLLVGVVGGAFWVKDVQNTLANLEEDLDVIAQAVDRDHANRWTAMQQAFWVEQAEGRFEMWLHDVEVALEAHETGEAIELPKLSLPSPQTWVEPTTLSR